jgi:type VI protein secretion system component VasK
MSGKLLGTAVGVALENHEAIRNVSAPAINAVGGVVQIIFRTFWKSTVVGLGLLVVWFASFAFTYILGGTNVLGSPTFTALFGLFLFLVLPSIICVREARRVTKDVARKNQAQRAERAARQAEYSQQLNSLSSNTSRSFSLSGKNS